MNFYESALNSIGIYPVETVRDGVSEKRTEWQEGWNACYSKIIDNVISIEKWFYSLDDRQKNILDKLDKEDYIHLSNEDGVVECSVVCNDFFYWACSDYEPINDWDLLEQSMKDAGDKDGPLLYCARKAKMRPQGAYYKYLNPENHHWFDACGKEREVNFCNPEER